jgi:hypothetical protein
MQAHSCYLSIACTESVYFQTSNKQTLHTCKINMLRTVHATINVYVKIYIL